MSYTANLESPFELVNAAGLGSLAATATIFKRSQFKLDASDFDGEVKWYFEVVGSNADSGSKDINLIDTTNGNEVISHVELAAGAAIELQDRIEFDPPEGAITYAVQTPTTASDGQVIVYAARIIAVQTGATKTVVAIPLGSGLLVPSNSDDGSVSVTGTTGTTYGNTYRASRWAKAAAAWGTIAAVRAQYVMASSNASYIASVAVADTTALTTGIAETVMTTQATVPTLCETADFAWTVLTDARSFEVVCKSNNASRLAYVNSAHLLVFLTGLDKGEMYLRIGCARTGTAASSLTRYRYLWTAGNFSTPTVYFEVTGQCNEDGDRVDVYDVTTTDTGTTGHSEAGTPHNWIAGGGTKALWRSAALSLTDGNRYIVRAIASTATQELANGFLVVGFVGVAGATEMTTTGAASSLVASNSVTLRGRQATATSASASLAASNTLSLRTRSLTTAAASAGLSAASSTALKAHTTLTTAASGSLAATNAVALKEHTTLTTAAASSLVAASSILNRARSAVTTAAASTLSAANTIVLRLRQATAASSSASLTAADSVAIKAHDTLTTLAAASLTSSSAELDKTETVITQLTTVAASGSLAASDALPLRSRSLVTTAASSSSVSSGAAIEQIFLIYTPANTTGLTASSAVLRRNVKDAYATASTASLTTSSSSLRRMLKTTVSAASLSSSSAIPVRCIPTTQSSSSLSASPASMLKVNSGYPAAKYLSTFAAESSLTATDAEVKPTSALHPNAASFNTEASPAALAKETIGLPEITYLSTFEATAGLSSSGTLASMRCLTTSTSGASLSTSVAGMFDPALFDPTLFDTAPVYSSLLRLRSVTTSTSSSSLVADAARCGSSRWLFPLESSGSLTASSIEVMVSTFKGFRPVGSHPTSVRDTMRLPRQRGAKCL